jgi:uncharacterized coiled-coil DUF342 family protein
MLTETQKKQVKNYVDDFKQKSMEYLHEKDQLENILETLDLKEKELSNVAKEERQIAAALEVLYGQSNSASKIGEIQKEITELQSKCNYARSKVNELTAKLLELLRNLPIPADLEHPEQTDSDTSFPFFEDSRLSNEAILTISNLLRRESPPVFGSATIFADKVTVRNTSDKPEAIQKLVEAIGEFRMTTDNMSKSYEKIDELVDRLERSTLYLQLLRIIEKNPRISSSQIAENLHIDERKVYDNCYNLTRSNWNPPPIKKSRFGEWELTIAGEILLNRFLEKYPEEEKESHEVDTR